MNRRMRNRRVNYHLTGESAEESFSNDEIALAKLEDQLGSDEYEQYMLEVEDFDKTLGDFDYSDDDSKN